MLRLEEIVKKLQDRKLSTVATRTGMSYTTLWQIANGIQKSPKYKHVETLSDYFESEE
jgi:transcriptional regulator with XRE-family HTH domain